MAKRDKVFVIPVTHLDREWYASMEQFRVQLCEVMERVTDMLEQEPAFIYTLDGQTIPLTDYLEVHPQAYDRLKPHLGSGRLKLGPWYVQPDEFLVSGESHVRNLQLGRMECARFGADPLQVGYLPDSFGHIAQMPQILKGFGMEYAFMMRGLAPEAGRDFLWEAPDGTRVLGVHDNYGAAAVMDPERMEEGIKLISTSRDLAERIRENNQDALFRTDSGLHLFTYGGDHLPPLASLPKLVDEINKDGMLDEQAVIGGFDEFCFELADRCKGMELPVRTGELREGWDLVYLADTAATRQWLKRDNRIAENALLLFAEPIAALARWLGGADRTKLLEHAWRLLLQNHTHDGICGCSINAVHEEMGTRFRKCADIAGMVIERSLSAITSRLHTGPLAANEKALWVYHPAPSRTEMTIVLELEHDEGEQLADIVMQSSSGASLPVQLLKNTPFEEIRWELDTVQRFVKGWKAVVAVQTHSLPAYGYEVFKYQTLTQAERKKNREPAQAGETPLENLSPRFGRLENDNLLVTIHLNGTIDLVDKRMGRRFAGLHYFVDTGDAGDVYNYKHVGDGVKDSRDADWTIELLHNGPLQASYRISRVLQLPASLCEDNRLQRSNQYAACRLESVLTLRRGGRWLDIETTFHNEAKDHRLRVIFPTGLDAPAIHDDGHYYVNKREAGQFPFTHPHRLFVDLSDDAGGLAVFNDGISQYEVPKESGGDCALTLLRCQDVLYRNHFSGRHEAFSSGQSQGKHVFRYALYPHAGDWLQGEVAPAAAVWNAGVRSHLIKPSSGPLAPSGSIIGLSHPHWRLDAVYPSPQSESVFVRFHNVGSGDTSGELTWLTSIGGAYATDLAHQRIRELAVTDGRHVRLTVPGHGIVTIELLP